MPYGNVTLIEVEQVSCTATTLTVRVKVTISVPSNATILPPASWGTAWVLRNGSQVGPTGTLNVLTNAPPTLVLRTGDIPIVRDQGSFKLGNDDFLSARALPLWTIRIGEGDDDTGGNLDVNGCPIINVLPPSEEGEKRTAGRAPRRNNPRRNK